MAETEALISLVGQDRGLTKLLGAAGKSTNVLSDNLSDATGNLNDWNEGLGKNEKALATATRATMKAGKGIADWGDAAGKGYDRFTDGAEKTIDVADILNKKFVGFGARLIGLNKPLNGVNQYLQPMAGFFSDVAEQETAAGKAATILDAAEKPLVNTLRMAAEIAEGFAKQLENMGVLGEFAAEKMRALAGGLRGISRAVGIADTAGDIYLAADSAKKFAEEAGPAVLQTTQTMGTMFQTAGLGATLFGDRMKSATTVSKGYLAVQSVIPGVQNATAKSIAETIVKLGEFAEKATLIKTVATMMVNAYIATQNLNETLSAFEAMGVDTTYGKLALSMGLVGEQLIFNREAAQEFTTAAIAGYAKLQDQLAYVRTLGSASSKSFGELGTAMQNLVNGPLKNAITSTEASSALYGTMSAGVTNVAQATDFMAAGLKLSAGSGAEAQTTMDGLIKTMSSYGIASRDASVTAAKLNTIVENGIVSFPQLAGGFARVAGVAKSSGVSLDELGASISALTYSMTADDALTGFSSLLSSIAGQGAQSEAAIAALGIKFDINTVKTKGLAASLKDLYNATGGSTEKLKEIIPDSLAFTTALTLMTSGAGKTAQFTKDMAASTSESLDAMFDRRRESTMQRASALMNGFQEVVISFGDRLLPIIEPGISFLEGMLKTLNSLPEPVKATIGTLIVAQVAMGKSVDIGNSFAGMLTSIAKTLLIGRVASLLFTGQLLNEVAVLKTAYLAKGRYGEAILRVFGVEDMVAKATARSTAATAAKAAAETANAAATNVATAAKTIDVVVENASTGAVIGHTTATQVNTAAKANNTVITRIGAAAQALWAKAAAAGSVATGVFTTVLKVAAGALKAFWVSFGPITLVAGILASAFMVLQDFIPALGGAAGETNKTAEALDKVTLSMNGAGEAIDKGNQSAREYTGTINKLVIPALDWLTEKAISGSALSLIPGLGSGAKERARDFFNGIKNEMQAYLDAPVWAAIERSDQVLGERFANTMKQREKMQKGNLYTTEAKNILTSARAAQGAISALKGDDLEEALSADRKAMVQTKEANDKLVTGYKEQLETIKNPEQKAALQSRIDQLNAQTTGLENAQKAQEKYLRGMNTIAGAVDANTAATSVGKTSEFITKSMTDSLDKLPEFAKESARRTFMQIENVTNKNSPTQRRAATKLASAAKLMFNDLKNLGNINSPAELGEMRKNIDSYMDNINEAVEKGAISQETANTMREQLQNQTIKIDTPEFQFEGSILGSDQLDRIQKDRVSGVQATADKELLIQQTTQTKIAADRAENRISEQEAEKQLAAQGIAQTEITLQAEKNKFKQMTEGSQEYVAQQQRVAQLENQLREQKGQADEQQFQRQQQRQQRLAEIEASRITQPLKQQLANMDLVSKQLELQNALMQSRSSLTQIVGQYEEAQISNQLKVTQDIELQAKLQADLAVTRQNNLLKSQKVEEMTLEVSLRQNKLATEREIISNRIAVAENERAIATAKLEKLAAIRKKATDEELTLIDQQITGLEQQGQALSQQGTMAERSKRQQGEIAENSRKELQYKQAISRQGGALDVQLAKQREIIAGYEKQQQTAQLLGQYEEARINNQLKLTQDVVQQAALQTKLAVTRQANLLKDQALERAKARNQVGITQQALKELAIKQAMAREGGALDVQLAKQREIGAAYEKQQQIAKLSAQAVELAGQVQLNRADAATKAYERQNQLLSAQKDLLSAKSGQGEAYFQMAIDAEKSEHRRNKLTREMNLIRLATLARQQEMELKIFDIQQMQNQLALDREKIQNRVQAATSKAEIAGSFAELKKVESTPGATPEQIQAARYGYEAAIEKGAATAYAGRALEDQGGLQEMLATRQRDAMVINQRTAYDQARFTAASESEKRVLGKQMLAFGRGRVQEMGINPRAISVLNPNKPYVKGFTEGLTQAPATADFDQVRQDYIKQVQGGGNLPMQQQQAALEKIYQQPAVPGMDFKGQPSVTPNLGVQQAPTGNTAGNDAMLQTVTQISQTLNTLLEELRAGKLGGDSLTIQLESDGKQVRTMQSSDRGLTKDLKDIFTETKRRLK